MTTSDTAPACPFPFPRERDALPVEYASLRRKGELTRVRLHDGAEAWLATTFDDVREIMGDPRFSTNPRSPGYPTLTPARADLLMSENPQTFIRMDPPRHSRYRRLLTADFMISTVEKLAPAIRAAVNRFADDLERHGPPVDLMKHFALPLPTHMIAHMLGIPEEASDFIHAKSHDKLNIASDSKVAISADRDLKNYIAEVVRQRQRDGLGDDIVSRLIRTQVETGKIEFAELVATIDLLVRGGHETTATMISLGMLSLIENPEQKDLLVRNPHLIRNAIEEMLRFHTITQFVGTRVAIEDVTIGRTLVRKGEGVFALLLAANHDPSVFPEPDRFDVSRKTSGHMAFGFGVHQCLGQSLARAELQAAFEVLLTRFPNMELAVERPSLVFHKHTLVFGIASLPVKW